MSEAFDFEISIPKPIPQEAEELRSRLISFRRVIDACEQGQQSACKEAQLDLNFSRLAYEQLVSLQGGRRATRNDRCQVQQISYDTGKQVTSKKVVAGVIHFCVPSEGYWLTYYAENIQNAQDGLASVYAQRRR